MNQQRYESANRTCYGSCVKLTAWRLLLHCRDPEEAEAAACREGIAMAARWHDLPMVLETDMRLLLRR